jgi:transcription antitermination protein NusB
MQALFDMDMSGDDSGARFARFCRNFAVDDDVFPFFEKLVKGVIEHRAEIDAHIKKYADNWKISRMSGVDRNIIRVAVYEIIHCPDIPAKVSINEAIDIGKKFGTGESGAFINGILDGIWISIRDNVQKTI